MNEEMNEQESNQEHNEGGKEQDLSQYMPKSESLSLIHI